MAPELSIGEARALAIRAQALTGRRHRDPLRLLHSLAAVQIDTISVLARSHELVAFARLGAVAAKDVTTAFWGRDRTFEYWAHAACVLPIELWPLFAWRRRRYRRKYPQLTPVQREILARLRGAGALTIGDLGGARTAPGWWEWSPQKAAVEELLGRGEVVCTERRGFRRVYRLAEHAVPAALLADERDDAACHAALVRLAASRLGVATADDLADYFRLPVASVRGAAEAAGLTPVIVEEWSRPAWADPGALAAAGAAGPLRHRPVLLSPFDSLIWHRPRTERIFGFRHRLEAYTPAAKRLHGYFVMPLLAGGRLVGRVDPQRDGPVLRARQVSLEAGTIRPMAEALRAVASWVGCEHVTVGEVTPAAFAAPLRAAAG